MLRRLIGLIGQAAARLVPPAALVLALALAALLVVLLADAGAADYNYKY